MVIGLLGGSSLGGFFGQRLCAIVKPVDVEKLQAGGVEARGDEIGEALEHFVAEIVIFFALGAEAIGIEDQGFGAFQSACVEVPAIRRRNPNKIRWRHRLPER